MQSSRSAAITETITDNVNLSAEQAGPILSHSLRSACGPVRIRRDCAASLTTRSAPARNGARRPAQRVERVRDRNAGRFFFCLCRRQHFAFFLSPFGTQAADSTLANPNRTEVSTFSVSPYARPAGSAMSPRTRRASATVANAQQRGCDVGSRHVLRRNFGSAASRADVFVWSAQASHFEVPLFPPPPLRRARCVSWAITPELSARRYCRKGIEQLS